jgi:hypothetical protein
MMRNINRQRRLAESKNVWEDAGFVLVGERFLHSLSSIRRLQAQFPLSSSSSSITITPTSPSNFLTRSQAHRRCRVVVAVFAYYSTQIPAHNLKMQPNIGRNYPHARRGRFVHSPIFSLLPSILRYHSSPSLLPPIAYYDP